MIKFKERKQKVMNMLSKALVSNSDMIKNYKTCRQNSEELGKIFILKNNMPDAVLFSMEEYARLAPIIEYLDTYNGNDIETLVSGLVNRVTAPHTHIAGTVSESSQISS